AGSTLSMNSAVRNIVSYIGITIPQAIMMATANPARLLELKDRGKIEKGYLADIIMFDEDIYIRKVIKSGSQRL
ncbi:amidohydrolase family protein, partial [Lutispora sp.]|uniref:amidohydrolase family protein n=1 Tax=Lutispora sp. TaxID=2828727 RepID=UPI003567C2A7